MANRNECKIGLEMDEDGCKKRLGMNEQYNKNDSTTSVNDKC